MIKEFLYLDLVKIVINFMNIFKGAIPEKQIVVNHCFPLTGDENNFEVIGL